MRIHYTHFNKLLLRINENIPLIPLQNLSLCSLNYLETYLCRGFSPKFIRDCLGLLMTLDLDKLASR